MRAPLTALRRSFSPCCTRRTTYPGMLWLTSLAVTTNRDVTPSWRSIRHDRYDGSIGRQWPPTPGPGRNGRVAERLGGGGVDRLPDVDAERSGMDGQLVDEGDVHVAERVLEQLGQLRHPRRADRHGALDQASVERFDRLQAPRRQAGDDLRDANQRPLAVARDRCARASSRRGSRPRPSSPDAASSAGASSSSVVPG